MRQVDEISERSAARSLPAPAGPRSPTGPVPLIAHDRSIPPPADAVPFVPYLPAVAPKSSSPATGQVAITATGAATLGIANASPVPSTTPAPKRDFKRARKRLTVLAIILAIVLVVGFIFRNTAFVQRFTGSGYDSNPLPTTSFPMPTFAGANYTYTFESIHVVDGVPMFVSQTEHDEVDFTSSIAKLSIDTATAQIVDGEIDSALHHSAPSELFLDKTSTYQQSATATDPWVRVPLVPGSRAETVLNRGDIRMYQDVVDPALRSQQPGSVIDEIRHSVPVTTYTYTFALGDLYESAPRLFEWVRSMEGNAPDDTPVTVTISLDEQMLVRYLDVDLDSEAVIEQASNAGRDNGTYPYRSTFELTSIAVGTAPELTIPSEVADPTTTTAP